MNSAGLVYVADYFNSNLRAISPPSPGGSSTVWTVSALAGSDFDTGTTDGTGADARFNYPQGISVDSTGTLFVADADNHTIRKVTDAGAVSTYAGTALVGSYADGTGAAAGFNGTNGATSDSAGNLYVVDSNNSTIRKITPQGVVTTIAGTGFPGTADGTGAMAEFHYPQGITIDPAGNLYVADTGNHTIRKITPGGTVSTLAGLPGTAGSADGTGATATFSSPSGITSDAAGNLYVADAGNNIIRKITPLGDVTTIAGSAGNSGSSDSPVGLAATFNVPQAITIDTAGNLYVADTNNRTIRKITPQREVTTLAGSVNIGFADGAGAAANFANPSGITIDAVGNLYVADTGNHTIRKVTPAGLVSTLVGVAGSRGFTPGALPGVLSKPVGVTIVGRTLYISMANGVMQVSNVP